MGIAIERPQTPPPSYLLTPPPTGDFSKRVRFTDAAVANTTSRRSTKTVEGESLTTFFEEPQEGSDTELSDISEAETISTDETPITSPSSTTSVTSKSNIPGKNDPLAALAISLETRAATDPFPFMKLPLYVRKKVYEHLLVVPAIICVRQNHTSFHDEKRAFLYAERLEYLPGIAYALTQLTVDGYKVRFSRFAATNINILRVSKEVHAEAKAILYGKNAFELVKPTNEMSPPPDFSVRLFPSGCQRLVTRLNIRLRSFYGLHWLLSGGYNVMKNHYRGLDTLTLILEMDAAGKGFGKQWSRKEHEKWKVYIQRLHGEISKDVFGGSDLSKAKAVPTWINLRVLFNGESYDEKLPNDNTNATSDVVDEHAKQDELKRALVEAWELFKKGGK